MKTANDLAMPNTTTFAKTLSPRATLKSGENFPLFTGLPTVHLYKIKIYDQNMFSLFFFSRFRNTTFVVVGVYLKYHRHENLNDEQFSINTIISAG